MVLAHDRGGSGEPLLLIHGIGSQWQMWAPVLDRLRAEREVVAIDLPGFGESAPLDSGTEPSPEALARAVAAFLDELGWERPHVAGNSLVGWIALELAKLGRTASACALSPAGFWRGWERPYTQVSLRVSRASARMLAGRVDRLVLHAPMRAALFSQVVARPVRLPPADAAPAFRNLAACSGWDATLDAMGKREFSDPELVQAPVTIAWGEKDRLLLPRQAERAREMLPFARHVTLFGCGHVPTWDDPGLVARAILTSG